MPKHYDMTGLPSNTITNFADDFTLVLPEDVKAAFNVTVSFRLGDLTPSALKEIWSTCEFDGPAETKMREALASAFYANTGQDIADAWGLQGATRAEIRAFCDEMDADDGKATSA